MTVYEKMLNYDNLVGFEYKYLIFTVGRFYVKKKRKFKI